MKPPAITETDRPSSNIFSMPPGVNEFHDIYQSIGGILDARPFTAPTACIWCAAQFQCLARGLAVFYLFLVKAPVNIAQAAAKTVAAKQQRRMRIMANQSGTFIASITPKPAKVS